VQHFRLGAHQLIWIFPSRLLTGQARRLVTLCGVPFLLLGEWSAIYPLAIGWCLQPHLATCTPAPPPRERPSSRGLALIMRTLRYCLVSPSCLRSQGSSHCEMAVYRCSSRPTTKRPLHGYKVPNPNGLVSYPHQILNVYWTPSVRNRLAIISSSRGSGPQGGIMTVCTQHKRMSIF
jgi:hypothetical protein